METTRKITAAPAAIALRWLTLNGRIGVRTAALALAFTALAVGLLLSRDWLVAAGLSSLVVGVLPCVAMCALGLCMRGGGGGTPGAAKDAPTDLAATDRPRTEPARRTPSPEDPS